MRTLILSRALFALLFFGYFSSNVFAAKKVGLCKAIFQAPEMDQIQRQKWDLYKDLFKQSTEYDVNSTPSNFPRSARLNFPRGRRLETEKISNSAFVYEGLYPWELRPNRFDPDHFPKSISEIQRAEILEMSNIVLWSESLKKSPFSAFARLAMTKDFRMVAVIYHDSSKPLVEVGASFDERVLSAKLLSDLGIGPLFHGVVETPEGQAYVVDLLPGKPYQEGLAKRPNGRFLDDLATITSRLMEVGIIWHLDFQPFEFEDRLLIIDPEGYYQKLNLQRPYSWNENIDGWPDLLAREILKANDSIATDFIAGLRLKHPLLYRDVVTVLRAKYFDLPSSENTTVKRVFDYIGRW